MTGTTDDRRALEQRSDRVAAVAAVGRLACWRWESVAPRLVARVVAAGSIRSAVHRPLGPDLAVEVVIAVAVYGDLAVVVPSPDAVRSWDRPTTDVWSTATDNVGNINPQVRLRTVDRFQTTVAVFGGSPFTSSMVLDPRRVLRRSLGRSTSAHRFDHLVVLGDDLVLAGCDPAVADIAEDWHRLNPSTHQPTLLVVAPGATAATAAEQ